LAMPKVGREVGASSARTSYLAALAGPHGVGVRVRVRVRVGVRVRVRAGVRVRVSPALPGERPAQLGAQPPPRGRPS